MEVRKMQRRLAFAMALITTGAAGLAAVPAASAHGIPVEVGPAHITHIGMPSAGSSGSVGATSVTSTNWSGYALNGGTYQSVETTWKQPTVDCSKTPNSYAAFWAGLDGYSSSTVEQDGTLAECVASGGRHSRTQVAEYLGWYETYPNPMYQFGGTVYGGDTLTATVTETTPTMFTLVLKDATRGWTATTTQTLKSAPALSSAEVIAEAPSSRSGVLPLADFGSVSFSQSVVDNTSLDAFANPIVINMATSSGVPEATTGGLSDDTFTVNWDS